MKKTTFILNCQSPELAKKVFNQLGCTWSELIDNPSDYRNAANGVSGFIYYEETVLFAKKNAALILDALNEFERECGLLDKPSGDVAYWNWLAWFALEHVVDQVMYMLEEA
jgi:hypothetical protein